MKSGLKIVSLTFWAAYSDRESMVMTFQQISSKNDIFVLKWQRCLEAVVIMKGAKLESDIKFHKVKLGGVWGGWTGQKLIHFRLK